MATCSYSCDGAVAVEGTNGIAPYSYTWSTGDLDSTIENQCVGYYYITVQDAQGCQNIDSVEVSGPDELIIVLDSIRPLGCSGDCNGEITIHAEGGTPAYSFLWSNSETDTTISNLCQGNYSVTVTDVHNCVDSLDTLITAPIPIVLSFTDSVPLCNNGSADGEIYLDVQGGVPGYTYLWSSSDTTQNLIGIDGGWYTVSVTDTVGCQMVDSTFLAAAITVTATADSNTTICAKDSVQLYGSAVISDGTGYNYVWHPGTFMVDSNAQNPMVFVDTTTVFYFYVYHNNGVCFDVDSVTVSTYPFMAIDAGEDVTILHDQSTTLVSTGGSDSTLYQWLPDQYLETPTDYSTVATPEETTMYYVIATSEYGCISKDSVEVTVIPELIIPNGITPNGDGINDVWMLDYSYLFPDIEVEVFNRWGEQMFYSKGYPDSERWDGNYKGKPLPTGTYYYIIKLNDGIHNEPFTGPITVVR
jgi:gliding motility-associated-like protein